MRIFTAQLNPIIGDVQGNANRIIQAIRRGRQAQCDLVIFPELALTGYPPEDLLLLPHFIDAVHQQLHAIVQETYNIAAIVGFPRHNTSGIGKTLYNSVALLRNQQIEGYADKILLPTYDLFDERRYFEPGQNITIWKLKGLSLAITICEDLWCYEDILSSPHYCRNPTIEMQAKQPDLVLNLSASPYSFSKFGKRLRVFYHVVRLLKCPLIFCNQVGSNDGVIFDGYSFYMDNSGLQMCAKGFIEDDMLVDLAQEKHVLVLQRHVMNDLYRALVLGIRDYCAKLNFKNVCLGLSGGIDSAIVACLAVAALGAPHVIVLSMPSRYSSLESMRDAERLAACLAIELHELSIEAPLQSYLSLLQPLFEKTAEGVTEENLQARIRGMLLMAFSNKFGHMLLATSNKSELAMGYSTLYGDMCGGLAVIGDLVKRQVYALAHWINRQEEIIPFHTIQREPSAELRPDQKDSDTLPEYDIVDNVVRAYVESYHSAEDIAEIYHYPLPLVQDLIRRIHINEYKRRQAPPVIRVSERDFTAGRRFPIVQRWV